jgi:hypothetical protein
MTTMPSWEEVRVHVRGRFKVASETESAIELAWRIPTPGGAIEQRVQVAHIEVENEPWLAILVDVGPEAVLAHRSAIVHQDRQGFGALVLRDGRYLLRHSFPLPNAAWADVDRALRLVARTAAGLRMGLGGPKGGAPPFEIDGL